MEDDRFVLFLEILEGLDEEVQVVPVDGAEVTHSELFEEDVWEKEVLRTSLDLVGEAPHSLAANPLHKFRQIGRAHV